MRTIEIDPGATLETLPFEVYVLRGALSPSDRLRVASTVGKVSSEFAWVDRASALQHPTIIASRARGANERPTSCVRACGLRRCYGHCGREVGALTEDPPFCFELASAVVEATARRAGGVLEEMFVKSGEPYEPSHFWALVYGNGNGGKSRMAPHLDRPVGWTLSVSVGRPVRFSIGREPKQGDMYESYARHKAFPGQGGENALDIVINDGDAILFRGDRVFHSCDGFVGFEPASDESLRALMHGQETPQGYEPGRLALLFREERETQDKKVR
jgi:hypothetical protein